MRGFIAGLLVLVGLVLVPFADFGIWTRRQLLSTDAFTDLATDVVQQDAVQAALASRIADELGARDSRLRLGRAVLEPAVVQALDTPQFEQVFRLAVGSTHAQLERGDDQLTLNLDGVLPIVRDHVAPVDSGVASRIPDSGLLPTFTVLRKDQVPQLWFALEVTRQASWAFPVMMLVAFATAVLVASQRAGTLIAVGGGTAFVCLLLALALKSGRSILSDVVGPQVDIDAFNAGYGVVTDSLVTQTVVFALLGVLTAAVGVGLIVWRRSNARPSGWA